MDILLKGNGFQRRTSVLSNRETAAGRPGRGEYKLAFNAYNPEAVLSNPVKKPFIAFTTPRGFHPNLHPVDVEKIHKNLNKSRLDEARFSRMVSSRVSSWNSSKNIQKEELLRKMEQARVCKNLTPGAREDYQSDAEDFNYSYFNNIGKVRRLKNVILNVSRRPDYLAPSRYISMQPHSSYKILGYNRIENRNEKIKECLSVKKNLASRNVSVNLNALENQFFDIGFKGFPVGGEKLLRV